MYMLLIYLLSLENTVMALPCMNICSGSYCDSADLCLWGFCPLFKAVCIIHCSEFSRVLSMSIWKEESPGQFQNVLSLFKWELCVLF